MSLVNISTKGRSGISLLFILAAIFRCFDSLQTVLRLITLFAEIMKYHDEIVAGRFLNI
jgi:hypothetical protein